MSTPIQGNGASAGQIASAIWDSLLAAHVTAGTFGKRLGDAVGLDTFTAAKVAFLDEAISAAKSKLITKATGTFSLPNAITKATLLELLLNDDSVTISLDCSNLTQITIIGVEEEVDGATYRVLDTKEYPTDFDGEAVKITLTGKGRDQKITLQSTVLEGAARDVPHARVEEIKAV